MMMRKLITGIIILLINFTVFSQNQLTLKGVIVDSEEEFPISYASVHIKNQTLGTISDSLGRFSFDFGEEFKNDSVIISAIGYKRQIKKISDFNLKQEVTIELSDSLFLIDEVIALCYNNLELHSFGTEGGKKNKLLLSFATRSMDNAANFVKLIKEYHGKPKEKSDVLVWKKTDIKKFDVNKLNLTLATYKCSYCPLENEILVAVGIKDNHGNNLLANPEYAKFLEDYFQELLDISFEQGVDFNQLVENNGRMFLSTSEITYTGRAFSYYDKGQKGKIGEYLDGVPTGLWVWWYENGEKGKEVGYDDGEMAGTCKWWYSDGKLKRSSEFRKGKKEGLTEMYFPNGNKKFEGTYTNDVMHGTCTWWYESGEKKKESIYKNGVFIGKTEWDKKGNVIDKTYLD